MRLDQRVQRLQCLGDGAKLTGQGREAELHTFQGIAFGLAVQGLVLAELLEGDLASQKWTGSGRHALHVSR
jgi:hypothetical protein